MENKVKEYYKKVDEWIRKNPIKSAAIIIFVVGFLLGALIF